MKKNVILVMLSGVIAVLPIGKASGVGTTFFLDDFESYSTGTFPSAGGWEIVWNGMGTQHQVVSEAYSFSPTKSLQLWGRPNWSSVAQRKFSTNVPVIGYECAILIDSIGTGGPGREEILAFFNREAYIWGAYYAFVRFNHDDGEIKAEDGTVLGDWEPGVWYQVKVVLDRRTNTYAAWIDGELKGEGLSTTRSDTELIDAFALMSDHAGVKVYYDDVKVFALDAWKSSNPIPSDGATDVSRDVILSWDYPYGWIIMPTFDVYFGTNYDAVYNAKPSDPEYVGNVGHNQYHPSVPLDLGETYYWRADSVVPLELHKGTVWSFTTMGQLAVSDTAQWNIDFQGDENHNNTYGQTDPVDYSEPGVHWNIFEVAALRAPWPGPTNYATNPSMDLADDEGNFGVGKSSLVKFSIVGDAYGWAGGAGDDPLTGDYLIILNDFGVTNDPLMWRIIGLAPSTTYRLTYYHRANDLNRGINFVANGIATTVVDTAGLDVASAWVTTDWVGRITGTAAADSYDYSEGNWSALTISTVAATATNPYPANGATGVAINVLLSWSPGDYAASHDVYFGTSSPPVFIGNQATSSYDPGTLEPGTTYYWKIDEVNNLNPQSPWEGDLWSFTTVGKPAVGDYGDAPDPSFPSRSSSGGPCHLDVTQEWIGGPNSVTSIELDAIVPDGDADDKRAWWWFPPFGSVGWFVTQVSYDTANSDPNYPRYLNVLVDLDNSGTWDSGDEWPVQNFKVPFEDLPQDVGTMYVSARLPELIEPNDLPDKWTRVTLSERKVPDGSGAWGVFERGETEDFQINEDFQSKLDAPPTKFQVPSLHSPEASENVWPNISVECYHRFQGMEVLMCSNPLPKSNPYRWKIWIPKLEPDRWYNARILISATRKVHFYLDGVLVYISDNDITPDYEGQAAVGIGNRKSLYDNVLVAEPGLHVNQDPVFFKEDFSEPSVSDPLQWNLRWNLSSPDIETIDSDGTPPPCLFLDDNDYAVSKETFSYVDKSIEFSANIRQGNADSADQRFACLHVSESNEPGDDYFARIKVTGSSHPTNPNTVYCELLYLENGEEKLEESPPIPIPIQKVEQVSVRFVQNKDRWCPEDYTCSRLSTDESVFKSQNGSVIAKLTPPEEDVWVKLLEPDALGRLKPKFGLQFGSNVVDGYLCFSNILEVPLGQDSVRVEVKTTYDPPSVYVGIFDYSGYAPVAYNPGKVYIQQ